MSVTLSTILFALVGLTFVGISIPLIQNRVPPNRFYGFRTKKTLSDPKIWYEVNHIQGNDLLVAGALLTITSLLMLAFAQGWKSENVVITLVSVMVLSFTGVAVHGFRVLRRM